MLRNVYLHLVMCLNIIFDYILWNLLSRSSPRRMSFKECIKLNRGLYLSKKGE